MKILNFFLKFFNRKIIKIKIIDEMKIFNDAEYVFRGEFMITPKTKITVGHCSEITHEHYGYTLIKLIEVD